MKSSVRTTEIVVGAIKSIFGAVPYVGTALNEVFFDIRARVKQARIEQLIFELDENLKKIDENKISVDALKDERFSDFLELLIKKTASTHSKEKIKIFANILTSSIIEFDSLNWEEKELYISIISDLNEAEVIILKELFRLLPPQSKKNYSLSGEKHRENRINYSERVILGVPREIFKISLESLMAKSLVVDNSFSKLSHADPRTFINLTPLSVSLLSFIESTKQPTNS